jgi:negative regulator of flagellin synthesis FlgM
MQISGHGKVDHLAKLLLGVQDTEGTSSRQAAARTQVGSSEGTSTDSGAGQSA